MQTEYGVPVPRGVRKDWEANSMGREGAGSVLRRYHTPREWGDPAKCVAWFDRFERLRAVVGHYPNERSAVVRIDANGKWSATFGRVLASVDTHPQGQRPRRGAWFVSGAVGEAETPTRSRQSNKPGREM